MIVNVRDLKKYSFRDKKLGEWVTTVYTDNPKTNDRVVIAIKINKSKALSVRHAMQEAIERIKEPFETVKGA